MTARNPGSYPRRPRWPVILLALSGACGIAGANDEPAESSQLAQLMRQLELLEHTARQSAALNANTRSRYSFDYARLQADIARIRVGIQGHLTPERAQPRDAADLLGEYRQERVTP